MNNSKKHALKWNIILAASALFACSSVIFLLTNIKPAHALQPQPTEPTEAVQYTIMDEYDALLGNVLTQARTALDNVSKVFWLDPYTVPAPMPKEECYGTTDDPSSLHDILEESSGLLNGQDTLFRTDLELAPDSKITYYLDPSILVLTWQQVIDEFTYTISEVKISHPSQFRRYLANNEYNSDYTYPPTKMAETVNAVVASSADFYLGKNHGIIVYQGQLRQVEHIDKMDSCFIDENGDLLFAKAGKFSSAEEVQEYIEQKNIDFSLAFGPILIKNSKRCEPKVYLLGEVNGKFPRMALCQMDDLHYLLVTANGDFRAWKQPTIHQFAAHLEQFGCKSAYALDGGRTPVITMNGEVLNPRNRNERWVSDILYFATAIPPEKEAYG